jgi:hypothetical protein
MRITATEAIARGKQFVVTLDGIDVTKVAQWADEETGEVGVYPHALNESGTVTMLDAMTLVPVVMNGWRSLSPRPMHDFPETPLFTCHGIVTITEKPSVLSPFPSPVSAAKADYEALKEFVANGQSE